MYCDCTAYVKALLTKTKIHSKFNPAQAEKHGLLFDSQKQISACESKYQL